MLQWIKANLKNPASLPEEKLDLLAKDFERLEKINSTLPEGILRYVIDGEGEEILKTLGNTQDCATELKLLICGGNFAGKEINYRKKFFEKSDIKWSDLFLRLARVYEGAAKKCQVAYTYKTVSGFENFEWLQIFLLEVTFFGNYYSNQLNFKCNFPAEIIEEMLLLTGHSQDTIVKIPMSIASKFSWYVKPSLALFTALKGFPESMIKHKNTVITFLDSLKSPQKIQTLEIIENLKIPPEEFLEKLTELSLDSAKTVRETSEKLLYSIPDKAVPILKKFCKEGKSSEKLYAVKLLWKLMGHKEKDFLKEIEKTEKSKKVLQAISEMIVETEEISKKSEEIILPSVEKISPGAPLGEEILSSLEDLFDEYNRIMEGEYEKKKQFPYVQKQPVIEKKTATDIYKKLQSFVLKDDKIFKSPIYLNYYWNSKVMKMIKNFLEKPELELIHAVRFILMAGNSGFQQYQKRFFLDHDFSVLINHYRKSHSPKFNLRELAEVFDAIGLNKKLAGWHKIEDWHGGVFNYEAEALWPYFWEHIDIVEEVFELRPSAVKQPYYYDRARKRNNSYKILEILPVIPRNFENKLMEIAMGTPKSERPKARKCLSKVPGIQDKIISHLSSGKQETRALAAEWLSELGEKEAIPHIEKALKKETQDIPKGAFMSALEKLGVSVEKFLDMKNLLKEGEKTIKKGIPKGLEWFPFDKLPEVHWKDTGEGVEPDIIKHFILKCHKLNSPEPDPLTRLYTSYFKKREKEELGKFIIDSWLSYDTIPAHSYEEAYGLAEKQARAYIKWQSPGTAVEELTKRFLSDFLNQCKGSAIKEKGILAMGAACGGADSVPSVEKYLRKWHGHRVHQCKALIQMLSWIDEPSSIQLLLSVAKRFRTKGIQKEADKYVNEMAERKGWTVDELADRTIPTAGFDEKRKMEIDYGKRKFIATLGKDFKIELMTEDGKVIKSLPAPRKDDDPELAKDAKKTFSAAGKELKTIIKLQKERLYEGMCTERQWKFEDWNTFLNSHPIVSSYCQCIIWGVFEDNKLIKTFRPLDDGTLTDYEDGEVTVHSEAIIKIAHGTNISDERAKAWMEHMDDYEIKPLFQQFGSELYRLPEEKKEDTEISDFEGHMLDAFSLRGEATKRGYRRGTPQDAGWFFDYRKSFPGLSLEAVIEFTGNFVPEENRPVALMKLSFEKVSQEERSYGGNVKTSLGEIPPVLLSECYNDIKVMVSKGSGYDKDWEKKSQY